MDHLLPGDDPARARRDALDELLRPGPSRRPLFRRGGPAVVGPATRAPAPEPSGDAAAGLPAADDPVPAAPLRTRRATAGGGSGVHDLVARPPVRLAAVVVVLVTAVGWWWLRRPVPAEDRLPRVAASAEVTAPRAPGAGAAPSATRGDAAAGSPPVTTTPSGPVTVHVAGAVVRPGVVTLAGGGRVVDAVQAAGGMAAGADPDRVNLAARLVDGERVVVPIVGEAVPAEVPTAASGGEGRAVPGGPPPAGGPVDLNRADAEELDTLPGVGPSTAAAIVAHRESQGPFRSVDDLLDVRGIGDARLETLRPLVTVG